MSELIVTDGVMWTKHIHGDPALRARLNALPGTVEVELLIDGVAGYWRKMSDGRDGRPTSGLTPQGRMAALWRDLGATRRGEGVSIALPTPGPSRRGEATAGRIERTPQMREAALAAFLTPRGWRSDGRPLSRDEMHER